MSENERDPQADLALCEAATPGPWTGECGSLVNWRDDTFTMEFIPNRGGKPQYDADLSFMAMAREALPYWIRRCQAVEAELAQSRREYAEEIDEFNAGYQAAKDGLPESAEPEHCPHDVWLCGYAWGAFEGMKAELDRLRAENARLREQSEESALARLRAWREQSPKDRRWTREEDSGAPTLELYQHLGEYDSRYVCVASGDTFAMLVDAALAEWERKYGEDKPC